MRQSLHLISHFHGVVVSVVVVVVVGLHPPDVGGVGGVHSPGPWSWLLDRLLLLASHRHLLDAVHDVKVIFSECLNYFIIVKFFYATIFIGWEI